MAMRKDWYALLGVAPDASVQDIEIAFTQSMQRAHDHNARVVLRHARQVLTDPVSRTAYDTQLRAMASGRTGSGRTAGARVEPVGSGGIPVWGWGALALVLLSGVVWYSQRTPAPADNRVASSPVPKRPPAQATVALAAPPDGAPAASAPPARVGGLVGSPEAVYAMAAPSVVVVESQDGLGRAFSRGSGVAVGLQQVITNCHVIAQAAQIKVKQGGNEYLASPATSDTYLDLCLLQVPQLSAPAAQRTSVKSLRVGQTVYAIGSPQGLERTLSQGLVSALRETSEGTLIQTSAPISPGSSGGGLFDVQGQLVGITTFQTKSGQNLNFAIPVDWLDTMRTR